MKNYTRGFTSLLRPLTEEVLNLQTMLGCKVIPTSKVLRLGANVSSSPFAPCEQSKTNKPRLQTGMKGLIVTTGGTTVKVSY